MHSFLLRHLAAASVAMVASVSAPASWAQEATSEADAPAQEKRDARDELPRVLFVDSAFGMKGGTFGAAASGGGSFAQNQNKGIGGGLVAYAPIDRLTFDIAGGRTSDSRWAPVATGAFRFLGSLTQGYALAALLRYKAEGFTEYGGEVEFGFGTSLRSHRFVLDANLVTGIGLESEGAGAEKNAKAGEEPPTEVDGEAKLRIGYEVLDILRLGVEGQGRRRFSGPRALAGGRSWDLAVGAQAMLRLSPLLVAVTAGPTTKDVEKGAGAFAWLTVGFVL
ncbi:MAG: hypothetical protein ABI175_18980 [Polyangiales bacterium]